MTDKLVNEPMVRQRVLNEVNIHRDKGLRHPSIVRVCILLSDRESLGNIALAPLGSKLKEENIS